MTKILATNYYWANQFPAALPIAVRNVLGIEEGDQFKYVLQDDGTVTIEKV